MRHWYQQAAAFCRLRCRFATAGCRAIVTTRVMEMGHAADIGDEGRREPIGAASLAADAIMTLILCLATRSFMLLTAAYSAFEYRRDYASFITEF